MTGLHEYEPDPATLELRLVAPVDGCGCPECVKARLEHAIPCCCEACAKRRAKQNAAWSAAEVDE